MHRQSSPTDNSPEPPVRRFKPLPLRRKPTEALFYSEDIAAAAVHATLPPTTQRSRNLRGASPPTTKYYTPISAGVQDVRTPNYTATRSVEEDLLRASSQEAMRDEDGDADYFDHLQPPGNTKKRKVPLAHHSPYSSELQATRSGIADSGRVGQDGPGAAGLNPSRERDYAQHLESQRPSQRPSSTRKPPISAAARAGLSHKELLKTRKRQLVAVLGAMYNGDPLALDQALSSAQPFAKKDLYGSPNDAIRTRLSKRRTRKMARLSAKSYSTTSSSLEELTPDFTFSIPSTTSKRLAATRDEVATLHARFEVELAKQAAKAAEIAKRSARAAASAKRAANRQVFTDIGSDQASSLKGQKGLKKKKRSALANASNPHHLRNYVPSRVPHSGQAPPWASGTGVNSQNILGPLPLRFLSADLPPRSRTIGTRNSKGLATQTNSASQLTIPGEEWICAFCEYDLFYREDEASFRRAVRSRKRILSRRRRAREKAAATASGTKSSSTPAPSRSSPADNDTGPETEMGHGDLLEHPGGREGEFVSAKSKRERG